MALLTLITTFLWAAAASAQTTTTSSTDTTTTTTTATTTTTETTTVTQPAQTHTVTDTTTATNPSHTTSITNNTTVAGKPTSDTNGSGVAWWVWVLIALGAVAVAVGVFMLGRSQGAQQDTGPRAVPYSAATGQGSARRSGTPGGAAVTAATAARVTDKPVARTDIAPAYRTFWPVQTDPIWLLLNLARGTMT